MKVAQLLTRVCMVLPAAILFAQAQTPLSKPAFFVTISPENQKVKLGAKLEIRVLIQSTTDSTRLAHREASIGCSRFLVHVTSDNGKEPEKTEYYRHLLGEFLPGDGPDRSGGSCVSKDLRAGETLIQICDLSTYYKVIAPGRYDTWVEMDDDVRDPTKATVISYPVRSSNAHLEIGK